MFISKQLAVLLSSLAPASVYGADRHLDANGRRLVVEELLATKKKFLDVNAANKHQQQTSTRGLQSTFCTLGDIERDLEEEFDFYTRAGLNATSVACDTRFQDVCTTTVVTFLDDTGTNTTSREIESRCSTCTFSYPEECTLLGDCDPSGDECLNKQAVDGIGRSQFDKPPVYQQVPDADLAPGRVLLFSCTEEEEPEQCFSVSCDGGMCVDNSTDSVEVCRQVGRTDSFGTLEFQQATAQGIQYGCQAENRKRTFSSTYTLGVTNFVESVLTLGQKTGEGAVEGRFDTCEMALDGVQCNSCAICAEDDSGLLDVDCTNIIANATTSCDSFEDLLRYGIDVEQKFWLLQDGFIPSNSPTMTPTDSPTPVGGPSSAPAIFSSSLFASVAGALGCWMYLVV